MRILGKFFFEFKEWFADAADHLKLFFFEMRIESLKERIELEGKLGFVTNSREFTELSILSAIHDEISLRIKAREARHQQAVDH